MFTEQIVFAESEYRREQAKNSWPTRSDWPTRFARQPRRRLFAARQRGRLNKEGTSNRPARTDQTTAA